LRYVVLAALAAAIAVPAAASTGLTTYAITYGAHDLGTWNNMKMKVENGTYTATSFDSSAGGPGFKAIAFTRPFVAASDRDIFKNAQPPDVTLTVKAVKGGATVGTITCPTSRIYTFGTDGDPGNGTENIEFACLSISPGK
jgi:hypothetical protein